MHTMTKRHGKSGTIDVKALLREDEEFLRALVRTALQEVLEAEMTEALGAEKGERAAGRLGYRSGYYGRTLITRVGKLELRVPQDRTGRFSTELFERYQRSERALVAALAEMYVQMLRKSTAFVPRYQKFESISLQRRVERTSVREPGEIRYRRAVNLFVAPLRSP
jgi:transposase-like protein